MLAFYAAIIGSIVLFWLYDLGCFESFARWAHNRGTPNNNFVQVKEKDDSLTLIFCVNMVKEFSKFPSVDKKLSLLNGVDTVNSSVNWIKVTKNPKVPWNKVTPNVKKVVKENFNTTFR